VRSAVFFAAATSLSGSLACSAQVHANAEAKVGDEEAADFNKPLEGPVAEAPSSEAPANNEALLGARPDLSYKGPASATCKCLQVAVGQPGDAAFQWSGERPRTNPDTEIVIAVSSSGIACPERGASDLGASYWGYEMKNDDVVVVVEPALAGRPLTSGAIIPRPLGSGRVIVRPADKNVPYGRASSGSGACTIGQFAVGNSKPSPSMPPPPAGSAPVRIQGGAPEDDSSRVRMP
jgi:hypothetical protein